MRCFLAFVRLCHCGVDSGAWSRCGNSHGCGGGSNRVGGRWGEGEPKSWIGTGAVLAASFVVLLALGMSLVSVVAASVAAAASERWSRPLDDNLVLAPAVAAVIWILN